MNRKTGERAIGYKNNSANKKPIFLSSIVGEGDRSWRMCINYRALNFGGIYDPLKDNLKFHFPKNYKAYRQ